MTIVSHVEPLDIGVYARGLAYYFGYRSEAFAETMRGLGATADQEKRNVLYRQAQEIPAKDLATIFLFHLPTFGVRDAKLKGLWSNSPVQATDRTAIRRWEAS